MNNNSCFKSTCFRFLLILFVQLLQAQSNESFIFSSDRDIKVTAESYSAEGKTLDTISLAFIPKPGQVLWLVWNTGADPITGTFEGLPEGSIVVVNRDGATYHFALSYKGGDGNEITLNQYSRSATRRSTSTSGKIAVMEDLFTHIFVRLKKSAGSVTDIMTAEGG